MSNDNGASAIQRRGLMLVLSSPSGAGKTTLSRQLLDNDKQIQLSVSCTTRPKRPGERDGVDYRFVDTPTFRGMIERKQFLEYAEVFGNYYGTPRGPVAAASSPSNTRAVTATPRRWTASAAKQVAFCEFRGQKGAIDRDEWRPLAFALGVDRSRHFGSAPPRLSRSKRPC